jgi:hypothetical protein
VSLCRKPGSFCGLQLLPGQVLNHWLPKIHRVLAAVLIEQPPMEDELGWLAKVSDKVQLGL